MLLVLFKFALRRFLMVCFVSCHIACSFLLFVFASISVRRFTSLCMLCCFVSLARFVCLLGSFIVSYCLSAYVVVCCSFLFYVGSLGFLCVVLCSLCCLSLLCLLPFRVLSSEPSPGP